MIDELLSDVLVSPEEQEWIEKIEAVRAKMLASTEEIEIDDYGAVSPDLNLTQEEMYKGRKVKRLVGAMSHNAFSKDDALILFKIVRKMCPYFCLELGTSIGMSTAYVAAALQLNRGCGQIVTIEGAPAVHEIARRNFEQLNLAHIVIALSGRFKDVLPGALDTFGPFNYALIDGHHNGPATIEYFNQIIDYICPDGIIVFDDLNWSRGMSEAWEAIIQDDRVLEARCVRGLGIVLV